MSLTEQTNFSHHGLECDFEDKEGLNKMHLVGGAALQLARDVEKEKASERVVVAQDWVLTEDSDY